MKKLKKFLFSLFILISTTTFTQVVNLNPDTLGVPWLTGGVPNLTPEIQAIVDLLPRMTLKSTQTPPDSIDNSLHKFMRPIFGQSGGSCAQASGIGYIFTYELNWKRDSSANDSIYKHNWFPTHFTYNFLNEGSGGNGSFIYDGWDIVKEMGCPNVPSYGGMSVNNTYWMSGYEKYDTALLSRVDSLNTIDLSSNPQQGMDLIKQWLFDHNNEEDYGGLLSFQTNMQACNIVPFLPGTPHYGEYLVYKWENPYGGDHMLTIVGYNDSICYDLDLNDTISLDEYGAFKVYNSNGPGWYQNGYVYFPYKIFMQAGVVDPYVAYAVYVNDGQNNEVTLRANISHVCRDSLKIGVHWGETAESNHPGLPSNYYKALSFKGGSYPLLGDSVFDPMEITLEFSHFYSDEDFGKLFLYIKDRRLVHDSAFLNDLSLVDRRWGETFELFSDYNNTPIEQTYNWFHIDYDLIPHENTITHTDTLFSNMVSRFEPTVDNHSTLLIKQGVNIDFYNSNLIIKEGSTLIIEDSAVLYGKRGSSRIDIEGELQLGNNVTFIADSACELILNIKNTSITLSANNAHFENAELHSYCDSLTVVNSVFENGAYLKKYGGSLLVTECEFNNSFIYAFEGQENSIIEIDSCSLHNPTINGSPLFIDSYTHYNIHDNVISYSYGTGISLYNSGGIEGVGTHIIKDNEVYYTGSKKASLKNTGVKIYNSEADILDWNYIHDNDYGVSCLNYSQTKITGDTVTQCTEVSQRIINNNDHQVYISSASIPINFNYNELYESSYSTYFIYELTSQQSQITFDVTSNFWGDDLTGDPSDYIYTSLYPGWSPMCSYKSTNSAIVTKYDSAVSYIVAGDYISAENTFKEIIEDSLGSNYSYASLNQLFEIKKTYDQDFVGLKNYIDATTMLQDTNNLGKMADIISNKCDIELENYQVAVNFFEDIILNSGSCQDSIFAIIDIGYLYLKMNNSKSITVTSLLPQYIPESRKSYEIERDWLLDLLYTKHSGSSTENQEKINDSDNIISNLVLFPNPSNGIINLEFISKSTLALSFTIYDLSGKKVKEFSPAQYFKGNNNKKIDLSILNNGIYYLSIKSNGKSIANEKLILIK